MHLDEQSQDTKEPRSLALAVLAVLIVLAFVLRFLRLGTWGFDSDEIFMRHDSLRPRLTNPRPLLYLINHYLVLPFTPLDEFGLRLLPALFGALAVPALFLVTRRLLGTRTALLAAVLLTLSGQHVIYSQFGRYWSLVFLLTAIYPFAIYIGIRERDRGALALGIVAGVLASLAHPVSVLLVGGPVIWLLATYLRPRHLAVAWGRPAFRWGALVVAVLLALLAARFVPILQGWIYEHDTKGAFGQFLLRAPTPLGLKLVYYLLGYFQGWTFSLVLAAAVGLYLMWRAHDRTLAVFLTSVAVFPIVFITLISARTPVSAYYLIPVAPVFFIGAGFFLDRLYRQSWKVPPRWLVPTAVVALVLFEGIPTLVSQYLNGRRYDFKSTAEWLAPRLTPADIIFSDQPVALAFYTAPKEVERLRYDTLTLTTSLRTARQAGDGAALWVVAPSPAHAFRTTLRQGGLAAWLYDHCQMRNSIGHGRVDFRQQYLQVFRCPPAPPE